MSSVEQHSFQEVNALLSNQGLRVRMGPFNVCINTTCRFLATQLYKVYKDYKLTEDEIAEFHVRIDSARSVKKPFSSRVRFLVDGHSPLSLYPLEQSLAVLEWGINLAIAVRVNHLLLLHSAVVERNGRVILFPAWPGSGKTTLCTVLAHRGYRLFSDEMGLMDPQLKEFFPIPRLMPLKNESIQAIKKYLPDAILGREIPNTHKGTVAHVCPPRESILHASETAKAKWIIFPKWIANAPLKLEPLPDSEAFLLLASNSFNYEVLGEAGFDAVTYIIRTCDAFRMTYSNFDELIAAMNELTD